MNSPLATASTAPVRCVPLLALSIAVLACTSHPHVRSSPSTVTERCPEPPAQLSRSEASKPSWARDLILKPCERGCPGQASCLCTPEGQLAVREYESSSRPHELLDRSGNLEESWWYDAENRRSHQLVLTGAACRVEAFDHDGDGSVDQVCREFAGNPQSRTCGLYLRPLSAVACPARACPAGTTRCACDDRGRVIEAINDESHDRQTMEYDDAGRVRVLEHLRGDWLSQHDETHYDAQGRIIERVQRTRQGDGWTEGTFKTEWKPDGSSIETALSNGVVASTTERDVSVPGEVRVTFRSDAESWTTVARKAGEESVMVQLSGPMTLDWVSCKADADCATFIDTCACDADFRLNVRWLASLKSWRAKVCEEHHGAVACPAVERPPPNPKSRCVARLCVAGN